MLWCCLVILNIEFIAKISSYFVLWIFTIVDRTSHGSLRWYHFAVRRLFIQFDFNSFAIKPYIHVQYFEILLLLNVVYVDWVRIIYIKSYYFVILGLCKYWSESLMSTDLLKIIIFSYFCYSIRPETTLFNPKNWSVIMPSVSW